MTAIESRPAREDDVEAGRTIAEQLAGHVVRLRHSDIPEDVLAVARRLVLDQLGLQVRGSTLTHVQPVRRLVEGMAARAEAPVTGTAIRTTAAQAAYVNGTFGASMEYDDSHLLAWHGSSVLVSASLAMAEREGLGGRDVIEALVAGYQVMAALGGVCTMPMMVRGWHGPKTLGGFGAAAATGRLLRLPADTLADAFGIALSDASGTMEYDRSGGEVKRLHTGSAARAGIEAALLAQDGLTGPRTVFEGPRGFFQVFAGVTDLGRLEELWQDWHLRGTMFRLRPGVATVLPPLDLVSELQTEHGFGWQDVIGVDVGLPAFAVEHGGGIVHPTDAISAHFSLAFAIALRLVSGRSAPQDYVDPQRWSDPAIRQVSEVVRPYAYDFADDMPLLSGHVDIHLADGRTLTGTQAGFRGSTSIPAGEDEIVDKFRANVEGILTAERSRAVLQAVQRIDELADIRELTCHLQPEGRPEPS